MTLCDRVECDHEATWGLFLMLWAKGAPRESQPAKSTVVVRVCDVHRESMTAEEKAEWFGPAQRKQFAEAFRAKGYEVPDRCEVGFKRLAP